MLQNLYDRLEGNVEVRDRNFVVFRKLLAVALLPQNLIAQAFGLVQAEAQHTSLSQLVNSVAAVFLHDGISCNDTSRRKDTAIMHLMQNLYKDITTGHPRPMVWTYIGEQISLCFLFIGGHVLFYLMLYMCFQTVRGFSITLLQGMFRTTGEEIDQTYVLMYKLNS